MNAPITPTELLPIWPANLNEVPKEIFEREDIYQRELERIFCGAFWHPVAHLAEIPNQGDFKSFFLGETPILIVHGEDDRIRVFLNACTHRGTQLEPGTMGNKSHYECPYHRWLFDSQGELIGCPSSEDYCEDFDKADFRLVELRSEIRTGLIFATMSDEAIDLDAYLGEALSPISAGLGGDGRLKLLGYQKVIYNSNWKCYFDNDGFHAPLLHAAFKLLNWQGGKGRQYATKHGHLCFESQLKVPSNPDFLQDPSLIEFKGTDPNKGSVIAGLFPITGVVKHMDMLNIRFAFPRGLLATEVHYAYFAHQDDDEEMVRHRIRQSANLIGPSGLVSMEDAAVFNRLQIGTRTPGLAYFQKGVKDKRKLAYEFKQNDEWGNVPKWELYREVMGFRRQID